MLIASRFIITQRIILFFCGVCISFSSNAQIKTELWSSANRVNVYYHSTEGDVIGTPFLSEYWMLGKIFTTTDTIEAYIRYNILGKRMNFIHGEDTLEITKPFMIKKINFSNLDFIYAIEIETKGKIQFVNSDYFQVLTGKKDQMQLLVKISKSVEENTYVSYYMGGGGDGRMKIKDRRQLYLKNGNEGAIPVRKTRKSFIGIMSDKKEELITFIYDNKLIMKKEENLIKLVNFYNSLVYE